jgi:hypothetical protein
MRWLIAFVISLGLLQVGTALAALPDQILDQLCTSDSAPNCRARQQAAANTFLQWNPSASEDVDARTKCVEPYYTDKLVLNYVEIVACLQPYFDAKARAEAEGAKQSAEELAAIVTLCAQLTGNGSSTRMEYCASAWKAARFRYLTVVSPAAWREADYKALSECAAKNTFAINGRDVPDFDAINTCYFSR